MHFGFVFHESWSALVKSKFLRFYASGECYIENQNLGNIIKEIFWWNSQLYTNRYCVRQKKKIRQVV